MELSIFIELLLISIHWVKIFRFFSVYLLEIDQAQLKNSNWDIFLTTRLVSTEICSIEIFIFTLCYPIQIKVHKENITAKRETSEAYSERCQTSKIKQFCENT